MEKPIKRKKVAYCRSSLANLHTSDLDAYIRQIRQYGYQMQFSDLEIFTDKNQSGASQNKPALDRMMKAVRDKEIEMIIVPDFLHLTHSTTYLLKILDELQAYEVTLIVLNEKLNTSVASVKQLLTAISQFEKEVFIEKIKEGQAKAKTRRKIIGRRKQRNSELIRTLRKKGLTFRVIAELCGISQSSVATEIEEMKKETERFKNKSVKAN